jgi:hypothetical protein
MGDIAALLFKGRTEFKYPLTGAAYILAEPDPREPRSDQPPPELLVDDSL